MRKSNPAPLSLLRYATAVEVYDHMLADTRLAKETGIGMFFLVAVARQLLIYTAWLRTCNQPCAQVAATAAKQIVAPDVQLVLAVRPPLPRKPNPATLQPCTTPLGRSLGCCNSAQVVMTASTTWASPALTSATAGGLNETWPPEALQMQSMGAWQT